MLSNRWCWLVGHVWGEWRHDGNYIESFNARIRSCSRPTSRPHHYHFQRWNPYMGYR